MPSRVRDGRHRRRSRCTRCRWPRTRPARWSIGTTTTARSRPVRVFSLWQLGQKLHRRGQNGKRRNPGIDTWYRKHLRHGGGPHPPARSPTRVSPPTTKRDLFARMWATVNLWMIELTTFGSRAVVRVPELQGLLRYICKNGFEHHAAMSPTHTAEVLAEAFQTYFGWNTYHHQGVQQSRM